MEHEARLNREKKPPRKVKARIHKSEKSSSGSKEGHRGKSSKEKAEASGEKEAATSKVTISVPNVVEPSAAVLVTEVVVPKPAVVEPDIVCPSLILASYSFLTCSLLSSRFLFLEPKYLLIAMKLQILSLFALWEKQSIYFAYEFYYSLIQFSLIVIFGQRFISNYLFVHYIYYGVGLLLQSNLARKSGLSVYATGRFSTGASLGLGLIRLH